MHTSPENMFPLTTERLQLRMPDPAEADKMIRYYRENQAHLAPWEPTRPQKFYTERFWRILLENSRHDFANDQNLRLTIFLNSAPAEPVIGVCNFSHIIRGGFQACFLGYSLDSRYQGQGLMYEALTAAIGFMFDHLKLHRIMANYMPRNERSGKLLRRLGFVPEGYARDYLKIAGRWEDHILTALIRPEK